MLRNPRYRRQASALRSHCPPLLLHTVVSSSQCASRYRILSWPVRIRSISAGVGGSPAPPAAAAAARAAGGRATMDEVVAMRMAEVSVCASMSRREEDLEA